MGNTAKARHRRRRRSRAAAFLRANADPLPPYVVEVKDVRSFVISRLRFWARAGVLNKTALDAAILVKARWRWRWARTEARPSVQMDGGAK